MGNAEVRLNLYSSNIAFGENGKGERMGNENRWADIDGRGFADGMVCYAGNVLYSTLFGKSSAHGCVCVLILK